MGINFTGTKTHQLEEAASFYEQWMGGEENPELGYVVRSKDQTLDFLVKTGLAKIRPTAGKILKELKGERVRFLRSTGWLQSIDQFTLVEMRHQGESVYRLDLFVRDIYNRKRKKRFIGGK